MRLSPAALSLTLVSLGLVALASPAQAADPVIVQMDTSRGAITLALDADRAPVSVKNFVDYARAGQYNGTAFHRVIKGFMVQGGGFDATPLGYTERPTRAPIVNEGKNGLKNVRGSVAMARTSDPNSATAQFFVNTVNNAFLDYPGQDGHGYAVFGRVTEGMDVVDAISRTPTCDIPPLGSDVPCAPIILKKVTIASGGNATTAAATPTVSTTTTVTTSTTPAATTTSPTAGTTRKQRRTH